MARTTTRTTPLTAREQARFDALAAKGGYTVTLTQPKAAAKVTKGASTREVLSRKDWNRTLTAKARLMGKRDGVSVYSLVIDAWDEVQKSREAGMTPDQVLALV